MIPGFYGAKEDGTVQTFSRGGSDVTGSLVARAVHADIYENWTDVSGFLVTDPRIVENPAVIETITYRELRELPIWARQYFMRKPFPVRKEGFHQYQKYKPSSGQGNLYCGKHLPQAKICDHRNCRQKRVLFSI